MIIRLNCYKLDNVHETLKMMRNLMMIFWVVILCVDSQAHTDISKKYIISIVRASWTFPVVGFDISSATPWNFTINELVTSNTAVSYFKILS
jgi:hypothetical protein